MVCTRSPFNNVSEGLHLWGTGKCIRVGATAPYQLLISVIVVWGMTRCSVGIARLGEFCLVWPGNRETCLIRSYERFDTGQNDICAPVSMTKGDLTWQTFFLVKVGIVNPRSLYNVRWSLMIWISESFGLDPSQVNVTCMIIVSNRLSLQDQGMGV